METIWMREVSTTSKVEILGHVFDGLADIKRSVEIYCRFGCHSWNKDPKSTIEGIHVVCVYEPYPCFDSEDYANEDRDYSNYFFSVIPFTMQQIEQLSKFPRRYNVRIVTDAMPVWAVPAVYYSGEGDTMILATLD